MFHLPIETIESRFGSIPSMLPAPTWPDITFEKVRQLLPDAITIATLAAIESLLSAVVADGMTGTHHKSNAELLGQGFRIFRRASCHRSDRPDCYQYQSGSAYPGGWHHARSLAFYLYAVPRTADHQGSPCCFGRDIDSRGMEYVRDQTYQGDHEGASKRSYYFACHIYIDRIGRSEFCHPGGYRIGFDPLYRFNDEINPYPCGGK